MNEMGSVTVTSVALAGIAAAPHCYSQWGSRSLVDDSMSISNATSYAQDVTFPIVFSNMPSVILATMGNNNSYTRGEVYASWGNTTDFTLRGYITNKNAGTTVYARWLTVGT